MKPTKRNEQQIQKERNKVQMNKIMHLQKAYFKNDQEIIAVEQNILAELQAELENATPTPRSKVNPENSDQNNENGGLSSLRLKFGGAVLGQSKIDPAS